jgi:hypothetical protein
MPFVNPRAVLASDVVSKCRAGLLGLRNGLHEPSIRQIYPGDQARITHRRKPSSIAEQLVVVT